MKQHVEPRIFADKKGDWLPARPKLPTSLRPTDRLRSLVSVLTEYPPQPALVGLLTRRLIMSSAELIHYGVKGMKWGVRRAELSKNNPNYTPGQRDHDYLRRGVSKRGVKRINKRMNKGQDLETARKNEKKFVRRRRAAVAAAYIGARYSDPQTRALIKELGVIAMQHVAQRAETKRGQAFAAENMGIPRTASTGPKYTQKNRKGVYNISSM
jgi:hypothetical protein